MPIETLNPSHADGALLRRTVHTALACLDPAERSRPAYRQAAVWRRLAAPDCFCRFPVLWTDDGGRIRADRGFLACYEGPAPGGGLVFRTGLTGERIRALAFHELLQTHLAGPSRGVLLWGVDRDPASLSDGESMRLCRGLLSGLARCLPHPRGRVPLEGAPPRERGYLSLPLDAPAPEAPLTPDRAAGTGLCYFAESALRLAEGRGLDGRTVAVAGGGPLARAAGVMAGRLGARVLSGAREQFPEAADVVFLCCPETPLDGGTAAALADRRPAGVFEGCPLACLPEGAACLDAAGVLFAPAAAAGGGAHLTGGAATAWEAERMLRRGMDALCRELFSRQPGSLFRSALSRALIAAAEELLRRGVV